MGRSEWIRLHQVLQPIVGRDLGPPGALGPLGALGLGQKFNHERLVLTHIDGIIYGIYGIFKSEYGLK